MRNNSRKLCISFQKVRAHTGDHYNEQVDKLARGALTEVESGKIRMEEKLSG